MESGCSIFTCSPASNGLPALNNVIKFTSSQMDCVPSSSDNILVDCESSKDDSVSSYDDASILRSEENGIIDLDSLRKPTITLSKSVTLRNFESMSTSLIMNSSELANKSNDCSSTTEESIIIERTTGADKNVIDPLGSSITLSESDGEATNDSPSTTQPSGEVVSNEPTPVRGQSRVSSLEEMLTFTPISALAKDTSSSIAVPENSVVEILSADTTVQKKQLKVIVPGGAKKNGDGTVQPVKIPPELKECLQCNKTMNCSMKLDLNGVQCYICSDKCMVENRFAQKASLHRAIHKPPDSNRPVVTRKCGHCKESIPSPSDSTLSWETMDFCNEDCLKTYQNKLGLQCSYCHQQCQEQSLGKYCVRFGFDIRQFCHSSCLEEYKKGIKVCSFCQEDIPNNQGFMAAISERQQFKEFCSEDCMTNYDKMSSNMPVRLTASTCDVCNKFKLVTVEVIKADKRFTLCSDVCFNAFRFVHPNPMGFCDMCRKHFDTENVQDLFYTFSDDAAITFCSKTCMNAYVIFKRKIVQCNWCKVKKYNFDMIKKIFSNRQVMMLCSFHCFSMWKQSPKRNTCDHCKTFGQIQYHLGMSDGTLRSFCGHECLMKFQLQFKKVPVTPTSARPLDAAPTLAYPVMGATKIPQVSVKAPPPKKTTDNSGVVVASPGTSNSLATICAPPSRINDNTATIPVISSVTSLEPSDPPSTPDVSLPVTVNTPKPPPQRKSVGVIINKAGINTGSQMLVKQQLLLIPPPPVTMCNKSTYFSSHPATKSKGISCRPTAHPQSTQTDFNEQSSDLEEEDEVEGTKNDEEKRSNKLKSIKKRKGVLDSEDEETTVSGTDDISAEKTDDEMSEAEESSKSLEKIKEVPVVIPIPLPIYIPVPIPMYNVPVPSPVPLPVPMIVPLILPMPHETLDQALLDIQDLCKKMPPPTNCVPLSKNYESKKKEPLYYEYYHFGGHPRTKKRGPPYPDANEASGSGENSKKKRKVDIPTSYSNDEDSSLSPLRGQGNPPSGGSGGSGGSGDQPPNESFEYSSPSSPKKHLTCAYGVNAWKKWVLSKNVELVNAGEKPFGTELLWLSSEELSESLSLFVMEFRKPSGQTYPADILFYLVLGIQAYLCENGKDDNIFNDPQHSKFADTFNEIIVRETLVDNSGFLVPRIEEEHLWESRQLGVSSPFTLLLTLLYFTTKEFHITDLESQTKLGFSHMMRQWPRSQATSDQSVVNSKQTVRYFPPNQSRGDSSKSTSGQDGQTKYELHEIDDPLRCPVRLYCYYVSKCPESVRNRSDMFYLQPEQSFLDSSPRWYTSEPLDNSVLYKMFNRLKLVKETSLLIYPEPTIE